MCLEIVGSKKKVYLEGKKIPKRRANFFAKLKANEQYGLARTCLEVWSDAVTTFQTTICAQPPLLTNAFLGTVYSRLRIKKLLTFVSPQMFLPY